MPALTTIRMTLTGPFEGKTKTFNNKYRFVDGVTYFTGNDEQILCVSRLFTRSYQVKTEVITDEDLKTVIAKQAAAEKPEAVGVDDSAVISDKQIEEDEEAETDPPLPNHRQAAIIAAVNCIEKDKWVDMESNTPRPKVKDVQKQAKDPTINVAEIVEVISTWLS